MKGDVNDAVEVLSDFASLREQFDVLSAARRFDANVIIIIIIIIIINSIIIIIIIIISVSSSSCSSNSSSSINFRSILLIFL